MATTPGDARFDLSSLASIVTLFANIERELVATEKLDDAMTALTRTAVLTLPEADAAGVTLGRKGKFQTLGATDEYVLRTDDAQYKLSVRSLR